MELRADAAFFHSQPTPTDNTRLPAPNLRSHYRVGGAEQTSRYELGAASAVSRAAIGKMQIRTHAKN